MVSVQAELNSKKRYNDSLYPPDNLIEVTGYIYFEPEHKTNKHIAQSEKKKVAMVMFDCDMAEYYAWFLEKKHGVKLNKNVRRAHVTFINDWFYGINEIPNNPSKEAQWALLKKKYHRQKIKLTFSLDYHTNGKHWWLIVDHAYRHELLSIREEINLGRPSFGFHMTLGYVIDHSTVPQTKDRFDNTEWIQSHYIQSLGEKGFIKLKEEWRK